MTTHAPAPFVVGVARSGTTLLRMMLDAHPDLAIPPETGFLTRVLGYQPMLRHIPRRLSRLRAVDKVLNYATLARAQLRPSLAMDAETLRREIVSTRRFGDFQMDAAALERRIHSVQPWDVSQAVRAFYDLYRERFDKPRWGDKTPEYVMYMAPIQKLLPEARFIHIVRDGRDVYLSMAQTWWNVGHASKGAVFWRARLELARRQRRKLRHYLEVRYEDLVLQTEPTLRRICDFIELPWDAAMLRYHERSGERLRELGSVEMHDGTVRRQEDRTRIVQLTTQPPVAERVGRWKSEMSTADRHAFERVAGPLLRDLGYEVG